MSSRVCSGLIALAVGGLVALGVSGCTSGDDEATPSPSTSDSSSESPTPSVSPSTSPEPTAGSGGTAIGVDCLDLVSLDTMYQFDPNFGLDDSYSPASGTPGATAVADSGIACGWVQQTSGETIEISAAQPSADQLVELMAAAGADVTGAAFSTSGGKGIAQQFAGPYWVTASSSYFTAAADAQPLVDSAVAAVAALG